MDRFTEDFRTALIRARRKSGFSQAGIALKIGINISTYNGFETGKLIPTIQTARELSKVLNLPSGVFLFPEKYAIKG